MHVDVSSRIIILGPRDEVARYAMNPDNAPDWYANIKSVLWQTPPPLAVGSRVTFTAEFLRRRLAYTYEVTDLVPGTLLVMRTSEGPFPMETRYGFETAGKDGTRMTLRNRGAPGGFGRLLAPFMGMAIRIANRKDLRHLKQILETRATDG
jgi:hypothetical protein